MTFTACIPCSGDHVRYVGGQTWLSRPSTFCLLTARVLWRRMRISSTLECLVGQCCISVMSVIVQQIFFAFLVHHVVVLCENAAVSVCALLIRLNKVGVHLFCHLFVLMLL